MRRPPLGGFLQPPQRRTPARKSMLRGFFDGPARPHPPCPKKQGRGPRPHAPRRGNWKGRVPNPRHPSQRQEAPPRRAPLCRLLGAQHQLARARAAGLLTGPRAGSPRPDRQMAVDPRRTPQGQAVGGGRVPDPSRPSQRQPPPPGWRFAAPTAHNVSSQKHALWGW